MTNTREKTQKVIPTPYIIYLHFSRLNCRRLPLRSVTAGYFVQKLRGRLIIIISVQITSGKHLQQYIYLVSDISKKE